MPHIILEYTSNIGESTNWNRFFTKVHLLLHQEAGVQVEDCKSRAVRHESFFIGGGEEYGGFVHLEVGLLSGRSADLINRVGEVLLQLLVEEFGTGTAAAKVQLTVEVRDLVRDHYFKHPGGTFSTQK